MPHTSGHAILTRWSDRLAGLDRPPHVVLAEGDDPRVRAAARELGRYGVAPVLVSADGARGETVRCLTVTELAHGPAGERVAAAGRARGWPDQVIEARRNDPVYLAAGLVAAGGADACVAGCAHPTGEVIRAGVHVIGLSAGAPLLSSSFLLVLPDGRMVAFADCAVVPEPEEKQLAEIAVATASTYGALTGEEPVVAMLSFSTLGSADHESVRWVRSAAALVRKRRPDLAVEGELQFDAAFVESVAAHKAPGSAVAGRANVFIFPNLSAGNIGYKIAQRLGGAQAYGPVLQGLAAPMNDLSRGCDASEVVNVAVISALQAKSRAWDAAAGTRSLPGNEARRW